MNNIYIQAQEAMEELLAAAVTLKAGDMVVVGCSTSEICGQMIGTGSSQETAQAVMDALLPAAKERGLYLCIQCCEHLNRCLVAERACLEAYDLQQVWVRPQLHAGGAMAMEAMARFQDPVMVEDLKAKAAAGLDIGGTLIGMHLKPVAVPVHAKTRRIGQANLVMAWTRPKYVGGPRAQYDPIPHH